MDEHQDQGPNRDDLYANEYSNDCLDGYYSTTGRYQPQRPHHHHGWPLALLGGVMLVFSLAVLLTRIEDDMQAELTAGEPSVMQAESEAIVQAEAEENEDDTDEAAANMPNVAAADDTYVAAADDVHITIADPADGTLTLQEIYQKVIPSVVSITAYTDGSASSAGTGIVMTEDGYIVTNYHVVSGSTEVSALLSDGRTLDASIVGGDEATDLMVMKVDADGLTPAEFGDSDSVQVGDSVVAIGDPLGTELRGTMTDGIICGINRDVVIDGREMSLLQTNAALNNGNSGGPLVNMQGQVIGINTMKISSGYSSVEGIGFAIPISTAQPIVDELAEKGYISGRPDYGFSYSEITTRAVIYYRLPGYIIVTEVTPGSDAEAQGLQAQDIIVAVNGETITSEDDMTRIRNGFNAGDTVTLSIYRGTEPMDITITLGDQADQPDRLS